MQSRGRALLVLFASTTLACSGASSGQRGNGSDAGVDSATDSPLTDVVAPLDTGRPHDAASPGDTGPIDAGPLMVTCGFDTPTLVVTKSSGTGPGTTLLRLPLRFTGAASGITITTVTERAEDTSMTTLRDWNVSSLVPQAGYTGSVAPSSGVPNPSVLFTATATPVTAETDACKQQPWSRPGGTIHVTGTTKEAGAFAFDCSFGLNYLGNNAEPLRLACATGTPGWLGGQGSDSPGILSITTPIEAVLVTSGIHAYGAGPGAVSGFAFTGETLSSHLDTIVPPGLTCPMAAPMPWTLVSGTNTLWHGMTSSDTWSGPVTPGMQSDAEWQYELNGAMPMSGYCVPNSLMPLSCPAPVNQVVVTGTSSAGTFQWESDLFNCFLPM